MGTNLQQKKSGALVTPELSPNVWLPKLVYLATPVCKFHIFRGLFCIGTGQKPQSVKLNVMKKILISDANSCNFFSSNVCTKATKKQAIPYTR